MGPFMSQKTVNMTFFTDCCAWSVSVFPLYGLLLTQACSRKPMFNPFVNIFLFLLIHASLYTSHTLL